MMPSRAWWDTVNLFGSLQSQAEHVVASAWTVAMLSMWNCGLWLLKLILGIEDQYLTPDLSQGGPGAEVYQLTLWIAASLVVVMIMVQLGVAAVRRDGKSLARVIIGTFQFAGVWAGWIAVAVAVLVACGGLSRALLNALLHIDAMSAFTPFQGFSTTDITDATIATVLGVMGIFLIFSAIAHGLVMLARAGALMVLSATAPICAAGLVSEVGRSWFWKSLRWFLAAAFTPVIMALVLGIGVQMTTGVVTGYTDKLEQAVGTAVPGVFLILIACFAPLGLFKLLAFVDPGTSSGASMRTGLAAQGGVQGLLAGAGGADSSTSDAASSTDSNGKSAAESAGEGDTEQRFSNSGGSSGAGSGGGSGGAGSSGGAAGGLQGAIGAIGQGLAKGVGGVGDVANKAAVLGADLTNQMGAGHNNYVPDFSSSKKKDNQQQGSQKKGPTDDQNPDVNGTGQDGSAPVQAANPAAATGTDGPLPGPPTPGGPGGSEGGGPQGGGAPGGPGGSAGGAGGAAGGAGGGVEAAAAVAV